MAVFPDTSKTYLLSELEDYEQIELYNTPGWDLIRYCQAVDREVTSSCPDCYFCISEYPAYFRYTD